MRTSNASGGAPGAIPRKVVVDANPILSALISDQSAAFRAFWHGTSEEFATTAFTLEEVRRYFPLLAEKSGRSAEMLEVGLKLLPLVAYEPHVYERQRVEAEKRIAKRDPADVDLLALALHLNAPLWTNDQDFEVAGVMWYTTATLLKRLET